MSEVPADMAAVVAIVEGYVEACRTGDAERLSAIFHPAAQMFGQLGRTEFAKPIAEFVEHVRSSASPKASAEPYTANIRQVQVVGDTAVVTLEERGYQGRDYVDQFAILRSNGQWRIVTKLFAMTA
ncbi:nuclear transport factor 2 family protein [Phenylobacterium sp.]|uniref:nuclear transport factor 2 family protein n=1 Tax=Phenylobacterium sp. TaxID=1871053 RepID=UPI0035AFBFE8